MTDHAAKLDKIAQQLDEIRMAIHEIRVMYESHAQRLSRVEGVLFGNGRTGLTAQVKAILWIASGCLAFLAVVVAQVVQGWIVAL